MKTAFLVLVGVVVYIYFGYPLLLAIICPPEKKEKEASYGSSLPMVSMLIAAYNEQDIIEKKLLNTLQLDYPEDRLEVIVVSDGSTDDTNEIVKRYEKNGIKLNVFSERTGKTIVLRKTVPTVNGEIVLFSDANGMYKKDAIRKLVRNFSDERVGCVCGELLYIDSESSIAGKGENLYWKYERFLKRKESRACSVLGAAGSIFAVRKEIYVPLDVPIVDDFLEPIKIFEKGFRVVYEPEAISYEKASPSLSVEFERKKRIITQSIFGLMSIANMLNPLQFGFFSVQLISHKLLRWLVPFFLAAILAVNALLLENSIFLIMFVMQVVFYLAALVGMFLEKGGRRIVLFYIPLYFCMVNSAAFIGWFNFLNNNKLITWDTRRE